jgi:hypothetical protein
MTRKELAKLFMERLEEKHYEAVARRVKQAQQANAEDYRRPDPLKAMGYPGVWNA